MKIAGEMKIDILHGDNLSIAASRSAALNSENRSERRLTQRDRNILAYSAQTVCKTDSRRGLSFACGGRVYRSNENELSALACAVAQKSRVDLCLCPAILLEIFRRDVRTLGYYRYILRSRILCYFNIGQLCHY